MDSNLKSKNIFLEAAKDAQRLAARPASLFAHAFERISTRGIASAIGKIWGRVQGGGEASTLLNGVAAEQRPPVSTALTIGTALTVGGLS